MFFALIGLAVVLKAKFQKLSLILIFILIFLPDFILLSLLLFSLDILNYLRFIPYFLVDFDSTMIFVEGNLIISDAMKYSHNLLIIGVICIVIFIIIIALKEDRQQYILATLPLIHLAGTLFSIFHTVYLCYPIFPQFSGELSNIAFINFYLEQLFLRYLLQPAIPIDLIYWIVDISLFLVGVFFALYFNAVGDIKRKKKLLEKGESGAIKEVLRGAKRFHERSSNSASS
ncbi:MAG: hypothetical protein ACTSSI_01975 [Candidatus Helarchaeota archaeon]